MKVPYKPLDWDGHQLYWIDQTRLPTEMLVKSTTSYQEIIAAIKNLEIRGAPLIGIAAAYAVVLFLREYYPKTICKNLDTRWDEVLWEIGNARPTAVNLFNAIKRIQREIQKYPTKIAMDVALDVAQKVQNDEVKACDKIATIGSKICNQYSTILTHCNTGPLATGGVGTALGVIYKLKNIHKNLEVYVTETGPVGQGARLTVWELNQMGISTTLVPDNAVGALIQERKINAAIVGADRIVKNGDVANKVGTSNIACLCKQFHIPFYIAAPMTSVDTSLSKGDEIPIEFRNESEVFLKWAYPKHLQPKVFNPAFDITFSKWVTGYITDHGYFNLNDFKKHIKKIYLKGEVS